MPKRIGLIVGREWSFPPAFIEEVNRRDEGVVAELVQVGAPRMDEPCPYDVVIDRISHEVPFYRTYLKQAALEGATVINNPFMWSADDKFFGAALASKLGIAHPKTVVLPNKDYVPGVVPEESLRNLTYPLDWDGIVEYVGLPCVLKDAHGGGWKEVYVCESKEELIHHYDHSGLLTMVLQEFIEWDQFVRCLCLGQDDILPIKYDPRERRYHVEHEHLSPELGKRIVDDSRKLVRALGYDMNSMEWAVRDGVPYAIDFMNPAPDMDINSLTPHYFEWAVEHMADLAIRLAKEPRPQAREVGWAALFAGSRHDAPDAPAPKKATTKKPAAKKPAAKKTAGGAAKTTAASKKASGTTAGGAAKKSAAATKASTSGGAAASKPAAGGAAKKPAAAKATTKKPAAKKAPAKKTTASTKPSDAGDS